jgi:hypothetical protein
MSNGTYTQFEVLSLVAYERLCGHGFALPLYATSAKANALHIGVPSIPADARAKITRFEVYNADAPVALHKHLRRSSGSGCDWLDVFLWNGVVYVGTRAEIWNETLPVRGEMELTAPLSLLALAEGAHAEGGVSYAPAAYNWLAKEWGSSVADRWRLDTYLRNVVLLELRRRPVPATLTSEEAERTYREVQLVNRGTFLELRIPSLLASVAADPDFHLPRLTAACSAFDLNLELGGLAASTRKAKAPSSEPKTQRTRVNPPGAARRSAKVEAPEVRIFLSYSHKDAAAQEKLQTHLAPWKRDGVTVFVDKNIEPGAQLDPEIARELRRAHIFVALFSPSYLNSNYCWNIEYKRAMDRRARKLLRVIGVIVKPCGWKQTRAAGFKLLPKDGREPERWSSSDAAYVNIAEGIGEVIKTVRRELAAATASRSRTVAKLTPKAKAPAAKAATAGKARAKPAKARTQPRKV